MKVVAVGGRSFVAGFRLAGVTGIESDSPRQALKIVSELTAEKGVGLIILAEDLAKGVRQQITSLRSKRPVPLLYEAPVPGSKHERMEYRDMLKQILGI